MQLSGNGAVMNLAIRTLLHSDADREILSCFNNRPGSNMKCTWATAGAEGFPPPWSLSPSLYHTREIERVKGFKHRWKKYQPRKKERKEDQENMKHSREVKNRVHSALHTGTHGAEGRKMSFYSSFLIKKNNSTKVNAEEHKVGMDLSAEGWQWDQEVMVSQAELRSWITRQIMNNFPFNLG